MRKLKLTLYLVALFFASAYLLIFLGLNKNAHFTFATPWWLLTLILPVTLIYWGLNHPPRMQFNYSQLSVIKSKVSLKSLIKTCSSEVLRNLALLLICFCMARPQLGLTQTEITSDGIDIVLTIDASGSMDALDFELGGKTVNRLTVIKKVVNDFIRGRVADRIGVVSFGDMAFTLAPLTTDYDVLTQLVGKLDVSIAGDGTAIGDGLALSVKRIKDTKAISKVIILLTDGSNNAGSIAPEKAAELAKTFNIKVYTIGVGNDGLVPIRRPGPMGDMIVRAKMDFDEVLLQNIAAATGGQYFHAGDTDKLKKIYATIDQMEKTKATIRQYQTTQELFAPLLIAALAMLFLDLVLVTFWSKQLQA